MDDRKGISLGLRGASAQHPAGFSVKWREIKQSGLASAISHASLLDY